MTSRNIHPVIQFTEFHDMEMEESKQFLMNMSKELNQSFPYQFSNMQKTHMINQINNIQEKTRLKRSFSDPFGYFSKEV